jgi:CRISPR-associated protein Cas2
LDKNLLDKMADRIDKIIVEKEDSVRIYTLCANCEREIRVIGKGKVTKNEDVYII